MSSPAIYLASIKDYYLQVSELRPNCFVQEICNFRPD